MTSFFRSDRSTAILLCIGFLLSLALRWQNIQSEPKQHFEGITAHALVTMKVWEKRGGPSASHFAPIFTFPEPGNKYIANGHLPGIFNAAGDFYYVSYPPLSFLIPYYVFKSIGAPISFNSIRWFGLLIELLVLLFLFDLVKRIFTAQQNPQAKNLALTAALLYLFLPVTLWYQCNFYFADSLMQLFYIIMVWLYWRHKQENKFLFFFLLLLLAFISSLTDWLSYLVVFSISILYVKQKKYSHAVFILLPMVLGLISMLWLYAQIAGWDELLSVLNKKLILRSGWSTEDFSSEGLSYFTWHSYERILWFFASGFGLLLLYSLSSMGYKRKFSVADSMSDLKFIFFVPVLSHLILLFNFNVVHDFFVLKWSFILILLALPLFSFILQQQKKWMFISLMVVLLGNSIIYRALYSRSEGNYMLIGNQIRQWATDEERIYVNKGFYYNPIAVFYAERNYCSKGNAELAYRDAGNYNQPLLFFAFSDHSLDSVVHVSLSDEKKIIFNHSK